MSDGPNPMALASDMEQMAKYFAKVRAILGGRDAMLEGKDEYLPKLEDESPERYKLRCSGAKMTNVFDDVIENLAARPFSERVVLEENADAEFEEFAEDVDGSGTTLHSFAAEVFYNSIGYALDWILVDYTADVPYNATISDEKRMGARPYWVRYPADYVLAAYTAMIGGKEEFTHVRLYEPTTVQDGFSERTLERVRVLFRNQIAGPGEEGDETQGAWGPPMVELWEKTKTTEGKEEWVIIKPARPMSIGAIPLVPVLTGRRAGKSWVVKPPMRAAADLQVNLFQQETGLEFAKTMTAYPMLAGNGVAPEIGDDGEPKDVTVGPGRILFAPPAGEGQPGSWEILEPSAQSLTLLKNDIESTIKELRELGRQPLTANSGNLTRITTAVAAQKGNSAVLAWLMNLKEQIELCLWYTGQWLNKDATPTIVVNTEFDIALEEDDGFSHVLTLRKGREISREATLHEAKRRNILDRDYNPEDDIDKMLDELEDEETINPTPDPIEE